MKIKRQIIRIDESKCDGCGLCVSACHEGTLGIVDGKAKLLSESYCDGLGDCIGECPQGAISFEEREVDAYDEVAVQAHMQKMKPVVHGGCPGSVSRQFIGHMGGGCPGSASRQLSKSGGCPGSKVGFMERKGEETNLGESFSMLGNWPVQLKLIGENAPYLSGSEWLLAADCTAFACGDFHRRYMKDRVCMIACPKLDDGMFYVEKLSRMIGLHRPSCIRVVRMQVPCCGGLVKIAQLAVEMSGVETKLEIEVVPM